MGILRRQNLQGKRSFRNTFVQSMEGFQRSIKRRFFFIKINTVLIPSVNEEEIPAIAELAGSIGATVMNIIPLIPQADFKHLQRPSHKMLNSLREHCSQYISQITHCKHCRQMHMEFLEMTEISSLSY